MQPRVTGAVLERKAMVVFQDPAAPKSVEELHEDRCTVFIEGCLLLLLGCVAIVVSFLTGIVISVPVGWLLILSGLLGLWTGWSMRRVEGSGWALLSSVVALLAGAAFFAWPVGGLVSLTLMLGAYLTVDGVATYSQALQHRRVKIRNWGWLLVNGVLDILLAVVIVLWWPGVNAWLIGVIVGVGLIFAGSSLVALGGLARLPAAKTGAEYSGLVL